MSDTPRTDAAEIVQSFANHPELRTNRVPAEFARQLERELAAKDAHADEIYKAGVDLAAKLEADLEKERALADRLAAWLDTLLSGYDDAKEIACFDGEEAHCADRALKAWKASRDPNNLEGTGPTEEERRENARAIQAMSEPERFDLMFRNKEGGGE